MSTHKKQDDCTKDCDLINQIFAGEARESWHCRTHQRPYYPNKPHKKQDEELREKLDEIFSSFSKYVRHHAKYGVSTGQSVNQSEAKQLVMSLITERDKKRDAYIISDFATIDSSARGLASLKGVKYLQIVALGSTDEVARSPLHRVPPSKRSKEVI